jgi:hypothetical protein
MNDTHVLAALRETHRRLRHYRTPLNAGHPSVSKDHAPSGTVAGPARSPVPLLPHDVVREVSLACAMTLGVNSDRAHAVTLEYLAAVVRLHADFDRRLANELLTDGSMVIYLHRLASRLETRHHSSGNGDDDTVADELTKECLLVCASIAAIASAGSLAKAALWGNGDEHAALSPIVSLCTHVMFHGRKAAAFQQAARLVGNLCFGMDDSIATQAKRRMCSVLMPPLVTWTLRGLAELRVTTSSEAEPTIGTGIPAKYDERGGLRTVRWAAHAISSLVYGHAPNTEQRTALQHDVVRQCLLQGLQCAADILRTRFASPCVDATGEGAAAAEPHRPTSSRLLFDDAHGGDNDVAEKLKLSLLTTGTLLEAIANCIFRFPEGIAAAGEEAFDAARGAAIVLSHFVDELVPGAPTCRTAATVALRSAFFCIVAAERRLPGGIVALTDDVNVTAQWARAAGRDRKLASWLKKLSVGT